MRSRVCQGTVEDPGCEVCSECMAVSGVKREVVESWPDITEDFAGDNDDEGWKEEIRDGILSNVEKKTKGNRKRKKEEDEEVSFEEEDSEDEWNEQPKKKRGRKKKIKDEDEDEDNFDETPGKKKVKYQCPDGDCSTMFTKEISLVGHVLEHHGEKHSKITEGWVKCTEPGCFHPYKGKAPHIRHLMNHLKASHPESPILLGEKSERNECSYCGKVFRYNHSMKKHVETYHEAPMVPCHICGMMLKGQKSLSMHVKSVHDKTTVRHYCPEPGCTMSAVNSCHLKDHIAVVHRGQPR